MHDAQGATVVPGLIDAHAHLMGLGFALMQADLVGTRSKAEVVGRLQAFAAKLPADAWLLGRGWDQNDWSQRDFPTAADLDAAFPTRPVWLERVDGHAGWANTAAMRRVRRDLDGDWQPEGGRILREGGRPTGVFVDTATDLVGSVVPPPDDSVRTEALKRALAATARVGLTGVHDMGTSLDDLRLYQRFADQGALTLRVVAYADGDGARTRRIVPERRVSSPGRAAAHVGRQVLCRRRARVARRSAARAVQRRSTQSRDPGHGPGGAGSRHGESQALRTAGRDARDRRPRQPHGAGGLRARVGRPGAQRSPLADRARAGRRAYRHPAVRGTARHRVDAAHARHVRHALGRVAHRAAAPRRRLCVADGSCDAHVHIALGSDFPVESPDPRLGLYAAITRQDLAGSPPGGWVPSQRLTPAEALRGFTSDAAWAGFMEHEVGRLEPGMDADFVVLGGDPLTIPLDRLPSIKVISTWVDGTRVY